MRKNVAVYYPGCRFCRSVATLGRLQTVRRGVVSQDVGLKWGDCWVLADGKCRAPPLCAICLVLSVCCASRCSCGWGGPWQRCNLFVDFGWPQPVASHDARSRLKMARALPLHAPPSTLCSWAPTAGRNDAVAAPVNPLSPLRPLSPPSPKTANTGPIRATNWPACPPSLNQLSLSLQGDTGPALVCTPPLAPPAVSPAPPRSRSTISPPIPVLVQFNNQHQSPLDSTGPSGQRLSLPFSFSFLLAGLSVCLSLSLAPGLSLWLVALCSLNGDRCACTSPPG